MTSYRNIILIALFFLIATPPRAHGVIIDNGPKVNVLGLLACAPPGIPSFLGYPPFPGLSVNVTCNGGNVTLGQAVTNEDGFLDATFNVTEGQYIDFSTCMVTANVSGIANCSVLPPTGILRVSLVLVSIVRGVALVITWLTLP